MKSITPNEDDYSDLIVPMVGCSFGKPVYTCPFRKYWPNNSLYEKVEVLDQMKPDERLQLRQFHQQCIRLKRMTGTPLCSEELNSTLDKLLSQLGFIL